MPQSKPAPFATRLLAWWDEHGRKDLPWQHPRTPYRVWISEIMLQQTQVATVIPYFERWMDSYPDIATLAAAPEDEVLSHWSGLGYYARARNIIKTARVCTEHHGGQLPRGSEALNALPGIGLSTANAIVSQATDRPAAVLDGNVRRVLARHTATSGWTGSAAVQKTLWKAAQARLPGERGADYTQAIMDLGALVCRRANPSCAECPVDADCRALAENRTAEIPGSKPRSKVREKTLHMLIVQDGKGRVLLEKRPGTGVWGGLWCLPEAGARAVEYDAENAVELPLLTHRLSHLKLYIRPLLASPAKTTGVKCDTTLGWFDRHQRQALGLPRPVTHLLEKLDDGDFK
ncbi:MAG: A/G-specific adenine glycosylase [Gammaproteobacteria bacterium]|nr:A/G-specific adenine glycosylase [Gammaproteobacteria bacterium]